MSTAYRTLGRDHTNVEERHLAGDSVMGCKPSDRESENIADYVNCDIQRQYQMDKAVVMVGVRWWKERWRGNN